MPEDTYSMLVSADIVAPLRPLLRSGAFHINGAGKFECQAVSGWDTPWVHPHLSKDRNCLLWHKVIFDCFGFVPKRCHDCYKIVVRPRTVVELFKLHDLMEGLGLPSKCGIEQRATVNAIYGGYFYCDSLEQGRERYDIVRRAVDEQISPDLTVLLKRFCTEFEHRHGRSDQMEQTPEEAFHESVITRHFEPIPDYQQPGIVKIHVMRKWIEFAYQYGDQTAAELNDGHPLVAPYVTYHVCETLSDEKDENHGESA